jgi:TP901 family phage tail tape measure protein
MPIVRELITKWGFQVETNKVKTFHKAITSAKKSVKEIGRNLGPMVADIKKFGLALAGFATAFSAAVILPGLKLEDSIKETLTLVNVSGKEFLELEEKMIKKAVELSNATGVQATEINKGFYQVLSAGAEALSEDFNKLSEVSIKLAKTVGLPINDAIEKLADTIGAFGLELKDAEMVADRFFRISQLAQTSVPQIAQAMREASIVAKDMGISLEDTLAILGTFAKAGVKGAIAGTSFRQVFVKLAKPTDEAQKALNKYKIKLFDNNGEMKNAVDIIDILRVKTKDLTKEQQISFQKLVVGEEAYTKLGLLLKADTKVIREWSKAVSESDKVMFKAFDVRISSGIEKLNLIKTRIVNTASEISLTFIPKIKEMGESFDKWMTKNKDSIKEFGTAFLENMGWIIEKIVEYKDVLILAGEAAAGLWVAGKVIAYAEGIRLANREMAKLIALTLAIGEGKAGGAFLRKLGPLVAGVLATIGLPAVVVTAVGAAAIEGTSFAAGKIIDEKLKNELATTDKKKRVELEHQAFKIISDIFSASIGQTLGGSKFSVSERTEQLKGLSPKNKKLIESFIFGGEEFKTLGFSSRFTSQEIDDLVIAYAEANEKLVKVSKDTGKTAGSEFAKSFGKSLKDNLAFLHPGFDKAVLSNFQKFLTGQLNTTANPTGALASILGRKSILESTGETTGVNNINQGGNNVQVTKNYNIQSNDPIGLIKGIEDMEKELAFDLATSQLATDFGQ